MVRGSGGRRLILGILALLGLLVLGSGCDGCKGVEWELRYRARRAGKKECWDNNECKDTAVCKLPNAGPVCQLDFGSGQKGFCECLPFSWSREAGSLYNDAGGQWCRGYDCYIIWPRSPVDGGPN
jgi:hypothetical protein